MIKRLSIAQKFTLVLVFLLVVFSVLLAGLLINQAKQDLAFQQSQIQMQYYKQVELLKVFVSDRVTSFIESFANDLDATEFDETEQVLSLLSQQYEPLLLRWQVDEIWLFFDTREVALTSLQSPVDENVTLVMQNVLQAQRPETLLSCASSCAVTLGVPIIVGQELAIVSVRYSLAEVLASLAKSSSADVAVVEVDKANNAITLAGDLTEVNKQRFQQLIGALPSEINFSRFYQFGALVDAFDSTLLLNIVPLDGGVQDHYVLAVTDITERYSALRNQQVLIVSVAIILSLVFIGLVAFLLRQYRQKLTNLSLRLPLLAENRFDEFKELRLHRRSWFKDELDQLEDSATTLAHNLEQLNQQAIADQIQLEKMAMFDTLTGLPNRSMLMYQIEKHIGALKRSNKSVALMFLDLDDFKRINDSYGHGLGDALLGKLAKRVSKQLRIADIAARFGGDEFAVLLTDVNTQQDAEIVAEKLLQSFKAPVELKEHRFFVSVSIGIAITQEDDVTSTELLRHADIAMYEAKAVSGSAYRCYDAAMNRKLMRRVELENEARLAIQHDQFYLALQPKVSLKDGRLLGFESLIRWNHPEKGEISPAEFIPILEKTSLMGSLDYWVIAHSMQLLSQLSFNGYHGLSIAINVSAGQFLDSDLVDYLRQQLRHHDIPASRVELELTETALVDDLTRACEVMSLVRELGCKIAIDDFGTGYSSLSYLKALPVDVVKIDRSFVSGMLDDPGDRNIVYSSIAMVRGLDIEVVAEGIESAEQYALLCEFDCNVGQGFYISRPIHESQLWDVLFEQCREGLWQLPLPQQTTE
ncbi:putative bifunctional diguanylate cyclase/phosphodiesterase [Alteromonas facilis]|uniref:putative bifunctional diguanylate cyclase/phosphodiesterase n=1 Tax=Alteromonas facilis TaxID=2048004 RepID=UPI000C28B8DD|nr:EAL domain-containing protein [Alteromonas facilis]